MAYVTSSKRRAEARAQSDTRRRRRPNRFSNSASERR